MYIPTYLTAQHDIHDMYTYTYRTNVAQFMIGIHALGRQLAALGLAPTTGIEVRKAKLFTRPNLDPADRLTIILPPFSLVPPWPWSLWICLPLLGMSWLCNMVAPRPIKG